jgi:hypothetical protein
MKKIYPSSNSKITKPKNKTAHTAQTKIGMGDFYGSGPHSKRGKIRSAYLPGMNPIGPKKLKQPPKSLA